MESLNINAKISTKRQVISINRVENNLINKLSLPLYFQFKIFKKIINY